MIIEKSLKIKFMQKCKCGAVTIRFNNGASNSMRQDIFEQFYQIYGRDIQDVMGGVTGGAGVYR